MFRISYVHGEEDHLYRQVFYGMFFVRLCKQSSRWGEKTACTNGLPNDEQMLFETCRKHEELN